MSEEDLITMIEKDTEKGEVAPPLEKSKSPARPSAANQNLPLYGRWVPCTRNHAPFFRLPCIHGAGGLRSGGGQIRAPKD